MPKTRINCPNCRQPIVADVDQLIDVGVDPGAKQRLLSGIINLIQCPNCGYQGTLASPIVYHDPKKELLLTFIPPEMSMQRQEQERLIGQLINQVINRLPQEQRKGYLLQPQAALTMQGLVERVLEADGITREMLQAQQQRLSLLQRLASATDDEVIHEIVRQDEKLLDEDFYAILNRVIEAAMMGGDQEGAKRLSELQKKLLPLSSTGRQIQEQQQDIEAAIRSLQDAGKDLDREKLLDLVTKAPNDTSVSVYASLARPLMDYSFFQMLSERIDRARGNGRERLITLRERLLELTREIDQQIEERLQHARTNLETLLGAENIAQATQQNLQAIDEFFVRVVNEELEQARKKGDLDRISKLNQVITVLQRASAPPPELELIEELLDIDEEPDRQKWLSDHKDQITNEFMDLLTSVMSQSQASDDPEFIERVQKAYRSALKYSMQVNLNK